MERHREGFLEGCDLHYERPAAQAQQKRCLDAEDR
jgi:hypothetical protein